MTSKVDASCISLLAVRRSTTGVMTVSAANSRQHRVRLDIPSLTLNEDDAVVRDASRSSSSSSAADTTRVCVRLSPFIVLCFCAFLDGGANGTSLFSLFSTSS